MASVLILWLLCGVVCYFIMKSKGYVFMVQRPLYLGALPS